MDPLAVYLNVIEIIYELSLQPWSSEVNLTKVATTSITPRKLFVYLVSIRGSGVKLQPGYLILALRQAVFHMAQRMPGFFTLKAWPTLQGRQIGHIWLTLQPPWSIRMESPTALSSSGIAEPKGIIEDRQVNGSSSSLSASSGEFADDADEDFTIAYRFEGLDIPVQEIFTAILDGLTIAASYDQSGSCDWITGISAAGKAVFAITRKPGQELKCGRVSRALVLITTFPIVMGRKFQEVSVDLAYKGVVIGTGVLYRVRPVGEGSGMQGMAGLR